MMTMPGCGSHALWRTISSGSFTCQNHACASHRSDHRSSYRVLQQQRWFRLFFVPVVPLDRETQVVECTMCDARVRDVADAEPQPIEAAGSSGSSSAPSVRVFAPVVEPAELPARLVVGANRTADLMDGDVAVEARTPGTPAPPQRPPASPAATPATVCGMCDADRPEGADLCDACGAVFIDRVDRTCARHRIALPKGVDCPECGPDLAMASRPVVEREVRRQHVGVGSPAR